jgi:hypothetical protein
MNEAKKIGIHTPHANSYTYNHIYQMICIIIYLCIIHWNSYTHTNSHTHMNEALDFACGNSSSPSSSNRNRNRNRNSQDDAPSFEFTLVVYHVGTVVDAWKW